MTALAPLGFRKLPFTRELATGERFSLHFQQEAAEALHEAVTSRMSCALVAPAGTGKTLVLRLLTSQLPEARYHVHYVKVTGLSKRDLCKEISVACGLTPAGIYPTLVRRLQEHCLEAGGTDGVRLVLLLDEAHDLRAESLALLRLLTNFEMDSRLVLSVVLAGQPPLARMLERAGAEAVAQRLAHRATLRLLSRDETGAYIEHRCRLAGAQQLPLDADAVEAIFEMSRGNLRAIDRLSLKALQVAAKAGREVVGSGEVLAARTQLWL
ncbi:MAG: AAA family ATPase [Myxococcota bacterium]|jgi:type II secretory pathway predicted ATPase ExeA|nr:AAA family ATPase [Planctomycetota bacterium]MDP6943608.1 AAA family ATPase [Myxococcota bacterium]